MTRHRTYRVIATKTETLFIDVPARNKAGAVARAETLWQTDRQQFDAHMEHQPVRFEVDAEATLHLDDIVNEDRARWAKRALHAFSSETGSGAGEEGITDLICDLGHYAQANGIDYAEVLDRAGRIWAEETIDKLQETRDRPTTGAERTAEGGAQ